MQLTAYYPRKGLTSLSLTIKTEQFKILEYALIILFVISGSILLMSSINLISMFLVTKFAMIKNTIMKKQCINFLRGQSNCRAQSQPLSNVFNKYFQKFLEIMLAKTGIFEKSPDMLKVLFFISLFICLI